MLKRRRPGDVVRVRNPDTTSPFFFVNGKSGGWFIALTWRCGADVAVSWREFRRLLASSKGNVVIARRMVGEELRFFERYRDDIDHEVHARLIYKDAMRWRSPHKR